MSRSTRAPRKTAVKSEIAKPRKAQADLGVLQRWMQTVIVDPAGVEAGARAMQSQRGTLAIEDVVQPSRQLSAGERIALYSGMVQLRLVDCLAQDFPALQHALGRERFAQLASDYVVAHPSTHYSLNQLGKHLPAFARETLDGKPRAEFFAELAALERATEEVFDERRAEAIRADDLLGVPNDRWPRTRLVPSPALRLLETRYPVNAYYQAWREERSPELPRVRRSWVAVYRKEFVVWRMNLDRDRFELLQTLIGGATLGAALQRVTTTRGLDAQRIAQNLGAWFQEWAAEGFFCAVKTRKR